MKSTLLEASAVEPTIINSNTQQMPYTIPNNQLTIQDSRLIGVNLLTVPRRCKHIIIPNSDNFTFDKIGSSLTNPRCIFDSFDTYDITEITIMMTDTCPLNVVDYLTFYNCKNLTKLNFKKYPNCELIPLPDFMPTITLGCTNLCEVNIEEYRVKKVGHVFFIIQANEIVQDGIFYTQFGPDTDIIFPDNITNIGEQNFKSEKQLISIRIPGHIKKIDTEAFTKSGLREVILHNGVRNIEIAAFEDTDLTEITIPKSVREIGEYAFAGCNQLTKVIIQASNIIIKPSAFNKCINLKEIIVKPENITKIQSQLPETLQDKVVPCPKRKSGENGFFAHRIQQPPEKKRRTSEHKL